MNASCPFESLVQVSGLWSMTLKYNAVRKSAQLMEPPGCPDLAFVTILMMSLLT